MLQKLKAIGLCGDTVNWSHLYLTDQTFLVSIKNKHSNISKNSCGVPHRSILGLLLFLIYVNDMKQTVLSDLLLYADKSYLVFEHKHVSEIETHLNNDSSNLYEWFVDNKLRIHFEEEKTKPILFGTKHKLRKAGKLNVTAWYPNLNKNVKNKIQTTYNKYVYILFILFFSPLTSVIQLYNQ